MRILVTGGAGFIGSHLCERLLNLGHEVVCVDNLSTGSEKNIQNLIPNPKFQFVKYDLTFTNPLPEIINTQIILHLASPASPNKDNPQSYIHFPVETLLVNSWGTYLLLDEALRQRAKFLFASSSEVYGDPQVHPQREDYWGNVNPVGPRSCYDEGKRFGEAITFAYLRKFNLDICVARIFNTYGPKMPDDGRAVATFIKQALSPKPLTVFGDGSQTRSFCYIDDLIEGLSEMVLNDKVKGEVLNLGNPEEVSILELAKRVKSLTGSKSEITFSPLPEDDPERRCPDIGKAKKTLGWKPKVGLEEGLKKTIEYFKDQL